KRRVLFASPEETGFGQRATVDQPADIGVLVEALPPGVSGRIDRSVDITVELFRGAFASVSRAQLLNGANGIAIRSAAGSWEIVQFETAEEIEPDVWKLGNLLRGQLGTDDATAAGAEAGAHVVLLNEGVQAAGLSPSEIGLLLNWRVGPSGADFSAASFSDHAEVGGLRALLPLSPVHLRATKNTSGDVAIGWTRRGRIGADSWTASDIPLGEEREEYQVEIAHAGGAVVRTANSLTPGYNYGAADIAADFGAPPDEIDVTVRQFSLAAGWGIAAARRLSL
ncbi:MAG: host specificity protein, partial [Hyphomicrobiales bacterium]|nr:host specificity protein [Hyphomicrobiales bacterium]